MPRLPVPRSPRVTSYLLSGAVFYGAHLLAFALLAATAWVLGRLLLGSLPLAGTWEQLAVATALGIAGLAHLAFLLGLVHLLSRPALLLALVAIHIAGWWRGIWGDLPWRGAPLLTSPLTQPSPSQGGGTRPLVVFVALLVGLPLFLLALYPPTAFDATLYHLPDARAFARAGALPFLRDLRFPVFPQLDEVLFAAVLLLAGDISVHLVQLLAILGTAALLVAWGEGALSRRAGYLAAAAYLGSPIVIHLGTSAYVDAGLTLFTTAAIYALWRYRQSEHARGWLVLAAVFGASAAGVKYLGLIFLAAAALIVVFSRPRRPSRLLLFAVVSMTFLLPVYGRILYYTGNPVFPLFPAVFGHTAWDPETRLIAGSPPALPEALSRLATLPWDVVFARGRTGSQPPFSPFLLLALPFLALSALGDRRVRSWLLLACAYAALFPLLPPDSRYLLPALPLVCLALAACLDRPGFRQWSTVLALLLLLPGVLYAGYRVAHQGSPPVTPEARERYLAAHLPLYPAFAWLNREGGRGYTVYGFFAEDMNYFAEGTLLGDWNGPARFLNVLPSFSDPEALWQRLRGLGAGYLLVPRHRGLLRLPDGPASRRRFRPVYADPAADVFALEEARSRGR
jgi:hypothetical protein